VAISRRTFLRVAGAGAAAAAAAPAVGDECLAREATSVAAAVVKPRGPIRLNRNENAYGPSRPVRATIQRALDATNRYGEVEGEALRDAIASHHHVSRDHVVLGCGSAEVLRAAAECFVGPQQNLVMGVPTFPRIGEDARRAGAEVIRVPLTREFNHDLPQMLACSEAATGLVYICNPNNPTGMVTRRHDIDAFLQNLPRGIHVVIDEAYYHYVERSSDYTSLIERVADDTRLIVTRTFSKIYALAGLRVGYAIAAPDTVRRLETRLLGDGVSVVAASAAVAALDDSEHVALSMRRTANDRQEFLNQANARMVRTIDSQASFVMLKTGHGEEIVGHFKTHGVLLEPPFASLQNYIRVSLGTTAEMQDFWRVWDLMPHHISMSM
jgi:histidinol-phosphate aminotransferase